jgi:hypothetical protein
MSIGTKNPFFEISKEEQNLLEDLICESIQCYGMNCYYIARTFNDLDQLYGQDDSSSYTYAWPLALYIQNIQGFTGDKEFMDKLTGLEIRDQITFSIPMRTFDMVVAQDSNFPMMPNHLQLPANRPREGDLIFVNMRHLNKCFKIMFVNLTDVFWQLEKLYTWQVTVELFEYSDEVFNTGIPLIDRLQKKYSTNILDYVVNDVNGTTQIQIDPSGDYWVQDNYFAQVEQGTQDDTQELVSEANNYIDWNSDIDPWADSENKGGTI